MTTKIENVLKSVILKNQDVAPITKYVSSWLCIRLNTSGERKEKLAFKTVNGYFRLIASDLVEHLIETDLRNASEESLIAVYNQIIAGKSRANQHLTASQLQHFHKQICVNQLRIEEIDMADLTYEGEGEEPAIDASLIGPWELETSIKSINKQLEQSPHLAAQFKLLTTVYHRFGPRVSELLNIESNDVISQKNFKGSMSIRWNRLDRIKNPQSFRNISFKEKFSKTEFEYLHDCISIHAHSTQTHRAFWIYDLNNITHDPAYFRQTTSDLMKSITGDSSISNKSFRHSAVSLELMRFSAHVLNFENIENDLVEQMQLESFYPNGFDSFLKVVFTHNLPSRRYAYRTGRQLGHSTAKTTLTNYAHFYEFVLPYYFISDYGDRSNNLYKALADKTTDALKGLRKRNKNSLELGRKIVQQKVREQMPEIMLAQRVNRLTTSPKQVFINFKAPNNKPTPNLIYEALVYLKNTKNSNLEILKSRYLIDEQMLQSLETAYYRLFEKTAFNPFNFDIAIGIKPGFMVYTESNEPRDSIRLNDEFNLLTNPDTHQLTDILGLWFDYFNVTKKAWYFELMEQNIEFIRKLVAIGIPKSRIKLSTSNKTHDNKPSSEITGIKYHHSKEGASFPIPRKMSPSHSNKPTSGVLIMNKKNSRLLNTELNLIFSIIYLYHSMIS